jgi:hypothetical protein
MDLLLFLDYVFILFGDTLEMLRVFHEQQIYDIRCKVHEYVCLGSG